MMNYPPAGTAIWRLNDHRAPSATGEKKLHKYYYGKMLFSARQTKYEVTLLFLALISGLRRVHYNV